jgi:6-phosphogluconate dehydrogenase
MNKTNFGIIGLGVMGRNLGKNIAGNGFSLSAYNRMTPTEKDVVPNFLKNTNLDNIQGFTEMEAFVNSLAQPRKILLMVNAGAAVDSVIEQLQPLLNEGDIIIDGGNSHYRDTQRRVSELNQRRIHFLGVGISGGAFGALNGPSMMAGGSAEAYEEVRTIFEAISAKNKNDQTCVSLVGPDGSGHFVKTIHNGIEYVEMQLLAECYALLAPTHTYAQISALFREWNTGALSSYLLEITAHILETKEGEDYLLDKIVDKASSKGTGTWSSQAAFELGVPATMIHAAVSARFISMLKERRNSLSATIKSAQSITEIDTEQLKKAYTAARILNHYQGFEVIKAASAEHNWQIDLSTVACIWTEGCIIKSEFMNALVTILKDNDDLLQHSALISEVKNGETALIKIVNYALKLRAATPCISNSLQYWISITSEQSPANLIQAQRDYFGAHTYQRTDQPSSENFTTNWTKNG